MAFNEIVTDYSRLTEILEHRDRLIFLYMTMPDCGVCDAVKPRVEEMVGRCPGIDAYHVDMARDPKISGQLSVFIAPAVLVFHNGREMFREARFIVVDVIEPVISKLAALTAEDREGV